MGVEKLNARRVETARAEGRMSELRDEATIGLELRIMSSGVKTWSFNYSRKSDRKRRRMPIGHYPAMSLDQARRSADELRRAVDAGRDPAGEAKAERAADTFAELSDAWLKRHVGENAKASTDKEYRKMLALDVLPAIGAMKVNAVTPDDVQAMIDKVADRGSGYAANRTLAMLRAIYRWAIGTRRASVDPTYGLRKPTVEQARDRVLTDDEVAKFWRALDSAKMSEGLRIAFRLCLVTGQREDNVAAMAVADVDLTTGLWVIPKDAMKSGRADHRVPLSPLACKLIEDAIALTKGGEWVFPSKKGRGTGDGPIKGHALGTANLRAREAGVWGLADFRVHDLRRTAATGMGELGYLDDVIGKILDHADKGVTGQVYNRSRYDEPKRQALNAWAAKVEELVGLRQPATNVVRLADRATA